MASVRDVSFELFREHGMTTIFGNPGSTELPMLAEFPDDFRYVLGLQEAVAVGMADGYAQASGGPAHVNLHTAPGVGNGDGRDLQRPGKPLAAAGHRRPAGPGPHHHAGQPDQPRRDPGRPSVRQVELRAAARRRTCPHALARAIHTAALAAEGPDLRIAADGRLDRGGGRRVRPRRRAHSRAEDGPGPAGDRGLAQRLAAASNPVLVAGPDIDAAGAWNDAVALAERQKLPVFASPAPGGGRLGFPEGHPLFQGDPAAGDRAGRRDAQGPRPDPRRRLLRLPLLPLHPRAAAARGRRLVAITSDPDEAARAPMGDVILADVGLALRALVAEVGEANRPEPEPLPEPTRRR